MSIAEERCTKPSNQPVSRTRKARKDGSPPVVAGGDPDLCFVEPYAPMVNTCMLPSRAVAAIALPLPAKLRGFWGLSFRAN